MLNQQPTWHKLIDAAHILQRSLQTIPHSNCIEMVEAAAASGQVAIRGVPYGKSSPEIISVGRFPGARVQVSAMGCTLNISGHFTPGTWGDPMGGTRDGGKWDDVEINVVALVPYVRANLIPSGFHVTAAEEIAPLEPTASERATPASTISSKVSAHDKDGRLARSAPPQLNKVIAWFKDRVETWPPDAPKPTEREDLEAVRNALGDVRRAQLRKAVEAVDVPKNWRKRGPRSL